MPMRRVSQPDPRLLVENMRDDLAETLRGYDRSPEAKPSPHLWRGALPTDLAAGEHRVEVRAFDAWQGEQRAGTPYRLQPLPDPPLAPRTARRPPGPAITTPCRTGKGQVRAFDAWQGEQRAGTTYRLQPLPEPPLGH